MGFVLKTNCKKKPFIVFHFWEFQKQQQEDIAVSPQYWARAAASKVVEQQASPKISNFPFWFSQNQKTNSILRKGFEIENSLAVMSPLNGHNKGPYKRSFWFQHLWFETIRLPWNVLVAWPRGEGWWWNDTWAPLGRLLRKLVMGRVRGRRRPTAQPDVGVDRSGNLNPQALAEPVRHAAGSQTVNL